MLKAIRNQKGQGFMEYVLAISLALTAAVAVFAAMNTDITTIINHGAKVLDDASKVFAGGCGGGGGWHL